MLLTIIVVGVIAGLGIPHELFPKGYESKFLMVYVPWQNAVTQEVLDKVTLPLEEELSTVKSLKELRSYTWRTGARAFMIFKRKADMAVAYREVRDRVERAKALFPEDIEKVYIRKWDPAAMPVVIIGVVADPEQPNVYDLIQKEVLLPLERIDGVAGITIDGLEERKILIEVDKNLAESYGLNIYDMAQELSSDNFTLASGNIRNSGKKFLLRSVSVYKTREEIENRILKFPIRVKDVARVLYEEEDKHYRVQFNSSPVIALNIRKEAEANTVEVCKRIGEVLEKFEDNPRLASVDFTPFLDQGKIIQDSIGNLIGSGRIGGLLAGLVLFLFLRRFRLTLVVTLSIPLSLVIALSAIYFKGDTLNLLSILALVICVGLLVDNSVVVAENIYRLRRNGMSRRDACLKGTGEIGFAITMATLTTVIVFLPAALVEGEGQFFLVRLAYPITVALLASLMAALVFVPLGVYLTMPSIEEYHPDMRQTGVSGSLNRWMTRLYEATFERINHLYNRLLEFFLNHRLDLVLILAVLFGITYYWTAKKLSIAGEVEGYPTDFRFHVDMSREYNFQDTLDYFDAVEKILHANKEEYRLENFLTVCHRGGGRIEGWFYQNEVDKEFKRETAEKLLDMIPEKPGVEIFYGEQSRIEDAKGKDVYVFQLEGDDPRVLTSLCEELEPVLLKVPGVIGIRNSENENQREISMVIDRNRLQSSGVNPDVVAGVIGYALRGRTLPRFNKDGKQIPVKVLYREEDRDTLSELNNFGVPTRNGSVLPISALTNVRFQPSTRGIFRKNKRVFESITLELNTKDAKQTKKRLYAIQTSMNLPEGVSWQFTGYNLQNEDVRNLAFASILSVLFIYLLMGFLFESFILPMSIILTIPLAGIGVVWIHYLTGQDLDFLGIVGGILLIGVVVNNGIVLIDYVNRLRNEGQNRWSAVLTAADRRFRPIIMTALTTIIGMIPLLVGKSSDMGMSYQSFGLTLIGGMSTATVLTLLVVPVFYTLFDDGRQFLLKTVSELAGKHPEKNRINHSAELKKT